MKKTLIAIALTSFFHFNSVYANNSLFLEESKIIESQSNKET